MENKKLFITRLIGFICFSLVFPVIYLSIRFELFTTKQNISVWAVIVLAVFIGVISVLIKYYLDGMKTRYSFLKQCLNGVVKIILPLTILLLVTVFIKNKMEWIENNMNMLIEAISILIGSEAIAIVINPLPKWAFDNNVQGLSEIADKILNKDKTEGGK